MIFGQLVQVLPSMFQVVRSVHSFIVVAVSGNLSVYKKTSPLHFVFSSLESPVASMLFWRKLLRINAFNSSYCYSFSNLKCDCNTLIRSVHNGNQQPCVTCHNVLLQIKPTWYIYTWMGKLVNVYPNASTNN